MDRGGRFFTHLADSMDLPGETVPGQCILELLGDSRILIEKHRGVTQYSREKIGVKVKYGCVSICGSELELTHMTAEQLVIQGRIDAVTLHRRG